MLDMYIAGFLLYSALASSLLSIRGQAEAGQVLKDLFSALWRSDTNTFAFLESLDADLFGGSVALMTMLLAAFGFTLCFLNLIIGVYCNLYSNLQGKAGLLHLKHRTSLTVSYLLEPVWPKEPIALQADYTDEDDDHNFTDLMRDAEGFILRRWQPETWLLLLSILLIIIWLLGAGLVSNERRAVMLAPVLSVALVTLQASQIPDDNMNIDIKLNGLEQNAENLQHDEDGQDLETDDEEDVYGSMRRRNSDGAMEGLDHA